MPNPTAMAANGLLRLACEPARRRAEAALRRPAAAQAATLRRILEAAAATAFGREHRLGPAMTPEEFRRAVPVRDYEGHRPWVERMAQGEGDVLVPGKAGVFETTSGTEHGLKLVPYPAALRAEFTEAIRGWMGDLYRSRPALARGRSYWSISPITRQASFTPGGARIGLENDSAYLGPVERLLARGLFAVPDAVARIPAMEYCRTATLVSLLRAEDLALISVWHPSFLALLWAHLLAQREAILRQVRDGGDRRRAERVARALDRPGVSPRDVWPRLAMISCWADGAAAGAAAALAAACPGVAVRGKGLLATEGVVTIPREDGGDPVPALRSHFLEFLPVGEALACGVEDLEIDRAYEVLLTTGGGLFRYRLGDVVRVTGFLAAAPRLRFEGRAGLVSDLCGEKLAEPFVVRALDTACRGTTFRLLAPAEGPGGGYTLFTEGGEVSLPALEEALGENPHYAHARRLGQLRPVRHFRIARHGEARFLDRLAGSGQRVGAIKPAVLSKVAGWERVFTGAWAPEAVEAVR
jgi:hypothetical protein